jgi:hypothetical protein
VIAPPGLNRFGDRVELPAPGISKLLMTYLSILKRPTYTMLEVNPLRNTIKDFTERTDVLRGYL